MPEAPAHHRSAASQYSRIGSRSTRPHGRHRTRPCRGFNSSAIASTPRLQVHAKGCPAVSPRCKKTSFDAGPVYRPARPLGRRSATPGDNTPVGTFHEWKDRLFASLGRSPAAAKRRGRSDRAIRMISSNRCDPRRADRIAFDASLPLTCLPTSPERRARLTWRARGLHNLPQRP